MVTRERDKYSFEHRAQLTVDLFSKRNLILNLRRCLNVRIFECTISIVTMSPQPRTSGVYILNSMVGESQLDSQPNHSATSRHIRLWRIPSIQDTNH